MLEIVESAIKLFGKRIKIPMGRVVPFGIGEDCDGDDDKTPSNKKACPEPEGINKEASNLTEEENDDESSILTNKKKIESKASILESSRAEDEQNESNNNSGDKSIKKPDKILPCPRCSSMDTKFCYYNNYNVNQPRHFCKTCQRYWTAGGSMRNVPVGAGRRKSKCSGPIQHYRHFSTPNSARAEPESIHHLQPLKSNGTVLSFGSDAPLSESVASVMNLVEKTMKNCEQLSGSSNSNDEVKESTNSNCYGFPPNAPYFNGTPWPYPWSPPAFCVPSFSIPLYPMNAYWSMPWLSPQLSTSPGSTSSCSVSNSPISGKHSREGNLLNHNNSDKGGSPNSGNHIWIPKTVRVVDQEKAGKCPAWASIEFKNDNGDSVSRGEGLFKAFQSGGGNKIHSSEVSQFLLANPAAVSRSFSFQES